ncbi:MAG TPA: MBL fold metallo-hydrolase, partial [Candidatus Egerieicola pullicola]|nr:MBL fold metallo-hydrolase [Candidatus Egerieicola pullicola]
LQEKGWTLQKILLTHGHFDHAMAVNDLVAATGAPVYIHKEDQELITDPNKFYVFHQPFGEFHPISALSLEDGQDIVQDELTFHCIHTPGHTKGSCVYLCGDVMFSGDTLFAGSCGRTDFYGGSHTQILQSLHKLADLAGNYRVLPGHEEETTLDYERKTNPYLGKMSYDDFF